MLNHSSTFPTSVLRRTLRPLLLAGVALPLAVTAAPAADETAKADATTSQSAEWHLTDLFDKQVENGQDETLGEIEDVVLKPGDPNYPAVLLSVGGIAGIGDRLVAVPLNELQRGPDGELIYPVSEDQLLAQPTYQRADSAMTGPLGPGKERSQEAMGEGNPSQSMESVPGALGLGDNAVPGAEQAQTGWAEGSWAADADYADRDAYTDDLRQGVATWRDQVAQDDSLTAAERSELEGLLDTVEVRADRLEQATEENWRALRGNVQAAAREAATALDEATPQTAETPQSD